MVRLSNCLFVFLNFIALISGCAAIGSSLYFKTHGISECQQMVQNPLAIMGTLLIVISILGLMGTFFKLTWVLWFYSFMAFLVIVGLTIFSIFVYVVSNPGRSKALVGVGFKENGGNYSQWLKNTVANERNWKGIRACLIEQKVCKNLEKSMQAMEFVNETKLSPVELGCCMPPTQCRFHHKNTTLWVGEGPAVPHKSPTIDDRDCDTWSNDPKKLCYDCHCCKLGVLEMTRLTWTIFALLDAIDVVIVVVAFGLGCITRRNILSDQKYCYRSTSHF